MGPDTSLNSIEVTPAHTRFIKKIIGYYDTELEAHLAYQEKLETYTFH